MNRGSNFSSILLVLLLGGALVYGILPMLTTPKVIETEKKAVNQAYVISASNLISVARMYHADCLLDGDTSQFDGKTNILDSLDVSGSKPDSGVVYINENQEIYIGAMFDDTCYSKDFTESEVTVKDNKYCE